LLKLFASALLAPDAPVERHGLLKRADAAVRDDGRWYVPAEKLEAIAAARRTLGIGLRKESGVTVEQSEPVFSNSAPMVETGPVAKTRSAIAYRSALRPKR
jgi:hypothetical protein